MFMLSEGSLQRKESVGQLFSFLVISGCCGSIQFFECRYPLMSIVCWICLHVSVYGPDVLASGVVDPFLPVISLCLLDCPCKYNTFFLVV